MKRLIALFVVVLAIVSCSEHRGTLRVHNPVSHSTRLSGAAVVVLGEDWSPEERLAVLRGLDILNEAANGNYVFEVIEPDWKLIVPYYGKRLPNGRCYDVIGIDSVTPFHKGIEHFDHVKGRPSTGGYAIRQECKHTSVKIVPFRVDSLDALTWVTMHEVGHAIGLQHDRKNLEALMYPAFNYYSTCTSEQCCVPKPDMQQLCSFIGCDVETTKFCY